MPGIICTTQSLTCGQGFIQAITDLCLPVVKTQSFKSKNKKVIKTV